MHRRCQTADQKLTIIFEKLKMVSEICVRRNKDKRGNVGAQDLHFLLDTNSYYNSNQDIQAKQSIINTTTTATSTTTTFTTTTPLLLHLL